MKKLGYGSKADIISQCKFRIGAYNLQRYFLDNDFYDITIPEVREALLASRSQNPTIVRPGELRKHLGRNNGVFEEAILSNKLRIITQDPYLPDEPHIYRIDLADTRI